MTTPKLRSKKARRRTIANNTEKRSAQDISTDDDETTKGQKAREQSRLNYSDEVKSTSVTHGFSRQQDRDDAADWNLQSGSGNYSTRGKNQDYDYNEDDQEDENAFVDQGLQTAERDRDYDSEVESPHHAVDQKSLLNQYASEDLKTDLGGKKTSVPQGRSQPNQK